MILVERHTVPLVSFSALVQARGLGDPAGKEGLASITANLLRRGTAQRTAEQIATELDQLGGTLDFEVAGYDYILGEAEFLKKDLAAGLDLLADTLSHPMFPEAEVAKRKHQMIDELREAKDHPPSVIGRFFRAALFSGHAYGRPWSGDETSLATLSRDDVVAFYRQRYGPATTTLSVVGDFETADMERQLQNAFGGWRSAAAPSSPPGSPAPARFKGRKLLLVDKPDSTQTFFMIGNTAIPRAHPDRVAVDVVNTAFGGRFTSMLNDALRVNSGLTYGARSRFEKARDGGLFYISSYTRNAATVQAIDMALDLLTKLHQTGLTEAQLQSVQAYMKGQFPPTIETTDQLARLLVELDFHGLNEHEVNDYFARVDAVTEADVRRVVAAHVPLENLVFALVGKSSEIKDAVAKYAPSVQVRPIAQPGFHAARPGSPAE